MPANSWPVLRRCELVRPNVAACPCLSVFAQMKRAPSDGALSDPDAAAILWNVQCFELWHLLRGVAELHFRVATVELVTWRAHVEPMITGSAIHRLARLLLSPFTIDLSGQVGEGMSRRTWQLVQLLHVLPLHLWLHPPLHPVIGPKTWEGVNADWVVALKIIHNCVL